MTITPTAEATGAATPAMNKAQLVALKPPRLPYHEAVEHRFGIDRAGWKALVEAIYPNAETADAVVMALSYCRARNLDPFKRPVHIVPMWSSVAGKMIETVWRANTLACPNRILARWSSAPSRARPGEASPRAKSAASRCYFPSGAGSRSHASSMERSAASSAPRSIGSKPMPNGSTPMCRTKCGRTVQSGSSKNAPRPERCAELSRKRSETRSPRRKWKDNTPLMARPMFRKSRSQKASRLLVPEGSVSLSRRSCRNHCPSPHRHRASFPNRSPPGKKAIPKSPMPSRPHLNDDDTRGFGPDAAIKKDISAALPFLDQLRENSDRIILAKYLTKDLQAISRYMRIHDDLVDSNSGYAR